MTALSAYRVEWRRPSRGQHGGRTLLRLRAGGVDVVATLSQGQVAGLMRDLVSSWREHEAWRTAKNAAGTGGPMRGADPLPLELESGVDLNAVLSSVPVLSEIDRLVMEPDVAAVLAGSGGAG